MLSFLFSKLLETRQSEYNGRVEVYRQFGKIRISSGGLTQSGGMVVTIWNKVLYHLAQNDFSSQPPRSILVLGLGAGSLIESLYRHWPKAKVTAIEIDPVMLDLAEKYFQIGRYKDLTVVRSDVLGWLQENQEKFDAILIDLYHGAAMPSQFQTDTFFTEVKKIMTERGIVVFNRVVLEGQYRQAKEFRKKLEKSFDIVEKIKTPTNWMLKVRKEC